MLFHLKDLRFYQSTFLLIYLSLEILTSIIKTGWSIVVELIDLVNSAIFLNKLSDIMNVPAAIPNWENSNASYLETISNFWN